jgi:AcrR family transcriptional regulator
MLKSQRDRRLDVSEAAWRVIAREGLDRTSLRAIAQELGCTTGVVTHYFRVGLWTKRISSAP